MRVKTVPPATYDYVELVLMKQSEVKCPIRNAYIKDNDKKVLVL